MPSSLRILVLVLLLGLVPQSVRAEQAARDFDVTSVDAQTLMFRRSRADGNGTEGFVIDANALVDTLKSRVLEARALGSLAEIGRVTEAEAQSPSSVAKTDTGGYEFSHRFAAPFASIAIRMHLDRLEDPSEGTVVDELLIVLALCVVLGLYALYRMTATQLVFAERSRNFVSAVSHELKTPLTAIRMYGEMLSEDIVADEAKRREYYRTITHESERLTRLIDNVLNLSRLERRKELNLRTGDIRPHLRDAIEVLQPHIERQGFKFVVEIAESLPNVQFEPDALKQVLFNLVDNSTKYGRDAGDKRVIVTLDRTEGGVRLGVRDFGPGVQPGQIRKIFLPFFRGEQELRRKFSGTGIGLALVRSLVVAMRGRVAAENLEPGLRVVVDLVS